MSPEDLADAATASYPILVLAVLLGAVVPVVPTGAVVSGAAALALHTSRVSFVEVVLLAAVAAFAGDCVLYAAFKGGRRGVLKLFPRGGDEHRLDDARRKLHERGWQVLVVSRLIPAGRIPILLAASATGYPWSKFLPGGALAALAWAIFYSALGLAGGSLFDNPLVGVGAAIVIVLAISAVTSLVNRLLHRRSVRA